MVEYEDNNILALLQMVEEPIAVNANALNAQISNVYDHHGNLGIHCSDSACSEPESESVVGVHWSCLHNYHFQFLGTSWRVSTTQNKSIYNGPHVFYTITVQ